MDMWMILSIYIMMMMKKNDDQMQMPMRYRSLEPKSKLMMIMMMSFLNKSELSSSMLLLMMNYHENRMTGSNNIRNSENYDLRNLQMMIVFSEMQRQRKVAEKSEIDPEVSEKTIEVINQFRGTFEKKLDDLYADLSENGDSELKCLFNDLLKEMMQEVGKQTINTVQKEVDITVCKNGIINFY